MKNWGEKLEEKIRMLPDSPGCYLMKNREGTIIYVGKAVNLKNRVRSYFRDTVHTPKVEAMIAHIDDFDILLCETNLEALILECNLIKLHKPSRITQVNGEKRIKSLSLNDGSELAVDGLFCLRNAVAPTTLLPKLELDGAHIVVNRKQETNLPGCFAAGDCTGLPYQIAKAVGEGNVAAHTILKYLAEQEETK